MNLRTLVAVAALILASPSIAQQEVSGGPVITDGDTIWIGNTKIRLNGIDAPETDQLCLDAKAQKWTCGIAARDALIARAGNKTWSCHITGMDRYKRSLATCEADGEDIQKWMTRNGWALSFVQYSHVYDADEAIAREAREGLWAGAFIAPWNWRHRDRSTKILGATSVPIDAQKILLSPASAADSPSPDCVIKGNINRKGECIYHQPGGRSYASVKMDLSKGKRWFCSPADAEAAGCRAAKN